MDLADAPDRTIPAGIIRDVVRGKLAPDPDPRGLRLRGAARRALTGRLERTWARFTGFALGYGYQPWRALIGLVAVVGVAVALSVAVGDCRMVDRIGVGLNLGAPLITTGSRCATNSAAAADFLTVAGWVLTSLGWAFATLFVAGFTGVVRKS